MSEVMFTGDTTRLIAQLNGSSLFSGNQPNPHPGYTGNYRQNTAMWSMQINTSGTGIQIDIDRWNPNWGAVPAGGHVVDVLQGVIGRTDTNQSSVRSALIGRGIYVGKPCTGEQ